MRTTDPTQEAFPVKRISSNQSRVNSARRKRKVRARHGQAGHWNARRQPMFNAGPVHYEVGANTDAMSFGGIAAVHRLVTKLGLVQHIDDRLELLKVHLPYHESDHVLNLAYNVLCGGTRLEDIERLRHDTAYMNALGADLIPDPTTAGDFCRRFREEDVITLMECINAVRAPLWQGRGRELLGPIAYIDVDGTLAPTYGKRKQGMDISYKGIWGYAPLVVSLANTKEVLYVVNRPGNVPSHTDAAQWIDRAMDHVDPHAERICLRGDTDFSLAHFDRWAVRADFIFGMDASAALRSRAEALDEACWQRLERAPRYEAHRPEAATLPGRREGAHRPRAGLRQLGAELRGRGRVQLPARQVRPAVSGSGSAQEYQQDEGRTRSVRRDPLLLLHHDPHGSQRRGSGPVRQRALRPGEHHRAAQSTRCGSPYTIWSATSWSSPPWLGISVVRPMHRKSERVHPHGVPALHPRIILIPCREITLRLIGYQPTLDRFFSAWRTIERTGFVVHGHSEGLLLARPPGRHSVAPDSYPLSPPHSA